MFRGKGRLLLLADACLTDPSDADSYMVVDTINSLARFRFDLRPWGQKFGYYYGEMEREYILAVRELYRGGAFVDVGSSLGLYVVCLGDRVAAAGAKVISVEPVAQNLQRQRRNVELNRYQHIVSYHQVALGSAAGELRISFDAESGDNNAIIGVHGGMTIPVIPLDRLVSETGCGKIGLIKMDVEGYEPEVVAGGRETIRRDRPVVFAEFNRERMAINGFDMAPSWSFFLDCGYRAYRLLAGKLVSLPHPGAVENIFFVPE